MADRYFARSASDRTEEWPYWFVADRQKGGLNVTRSLVPSLAGYLPLLPKDLAMNVARTANSGTLDG
jgi:hypothetical protein